MNPQSVSMSAHTPGPWAVGAEVASARFGGPSIRGGGATVAVVISGNGRADANAALIAAAPDLLAALRECITGDVNGTLNTGQRSRRLARIDAIACTAIARAEGRP